MNNINGYVNMRCFDFNDVVLKSLRKIAQNYFISLTHLYVLTEEYENVMNKNS